MPQDSTETLKTLGLATQLEVGFILPLTGMRGALEILRDYEDLTAEEHARFVSAAIEECGRLEQSVEELSSAVYAAASDDTGSATGDEAPAAAFAYASRLSFLEDESIVELDLSHLEFRDTRFVNEFYDVIDARLAATERRWHFIVDHTDCHVWPEAWIAFAHRGKRLLHVCGEGAVRYATDPSGPSNAHDGQEMLTSREAALTRIRDMQH